MKPAYADSPAEDKNKDRDDRINILVVEDDRTAMMFLTEQIKGLGHKIYTTINGRKALDFLESDGDKVDVVLMDWTMPVMDGMEAVGHMKEDPRLRHIPVIMLTASDKPEQIREGIDAGVFYYLTKPAKKEVLRSVLASAGQKAKQYKILARELQQHRKSFELIESCKFRFSTLAEAEGLAVFMANFFPEPERALLGLGELLVNAVEHGNLAIGYDRKKELVRDGCWRSEIERLQNIPDNAAKQAVATIACKKDGVYVVIEDQGNGFNWRDYIEINPANAGNGTGRGIAQARAVSFDKITYNVKGNKVVAYCGHRKKIQW